MPSPTTSPDSRVPAQRAPVLYRRMAALLYESVVLFGVLWLTGLVYGLVFNQRSGIADRHGLQIASVLVLAAYFIGFWTSAGQTVAMRAWRLRVVDTKMRPLSVARASLRFLLGWLWVLPPLALAWLLGLDHSGAFALLGGWIALWALASYLRADRQFWHDAWAGTRLIDTGS